MVDAKIPIRRFKNDPSAPSLAIEKLKLQFSKMEREDQIIAINGENGVSVSAWRSRERLLRYFTEGSFPRIYLIIGVAPNKTSLTIFFSLSWIK